MRTALGITLVVAFGCGSSEPESDAHFGLTNKADGTCNHVDACGGNVAGMWSLTEACYGVPKQTPSAECPGRTTAVKVDSVSGMYDFEQGGSYTGDVSIKGHFEFGFPMSCLNQGGMILQCSALSGTTSDGDMLTCTTSTSGGCTCSLPLILNIDDMGKYKSNGKKLDKGGETMDYCVQGDHLFMEPEMDMSSMSGMPMMDDIEVTFQIGFKKQ